MFSLAWPKDRAPASIGSAQVHDFIQAVQARLSGVVMHVVRHVSECTCTSSCSRSARSLLTWGSGGGGGWNSGPTTCQGRVIFNTVVAHPNRKLLEQLVRTVQSSPGSVWIPSKVGGQVAGGHRWLVGGCPALANHRAVG